MLLEGYIAIWKTYPKNEIKISVKRPSILAPSKKLMTEFLREKKRYMNGRGLSEWYARKSAWNEVHYESQFRKEILNNPKALVKLREIKELAKTKNVRLMCFEKRPPCHRFILIDMINNLEE